LSSFSIGPPLPNTWVKLLDDEGQEVAMGQAGEIAVKGPQVMAGYWQRPDETAKVMTADGYLKTGDIGTMDAKGYLTLRDRSKDMIIRGGSNIYPREIEEVLLRHPALAEVSVVGREEPDLGEEPVAFVVVKPSMTITTDEMDTLCLDNMARFKRPREYFFSDDLPKNNYGKILKTELRKQLAKGK
jgi:acyl-CoA synthetase (AMP-forming)/AMP-acid ligase II